MSGTAFSSWSYPPKGHSGIPTYAQRTSVPVPPPRLPQERERLQQAMWGDEEEE